MDATRASEPTAEDAATAEGAGRQTQAPSGQVTQQAAPEGVPGGAAANVPAAAPTTAPDVLSAASGASADRAASAGPTPAGPGVTAPQTKKSRVVKKAMPPKGTITPTAQPAGHPQHKTSDDTPTSAPTATAPAATPAVGTTPPAPAMGQKKVSRRVKRGTFRSVREASDPQGAVADTPHPGAARQDASNEGPQKEAYRASGTEPAAVGDEGAIWTARKGVHDKLGGATFLGPVGHPAAGVTVEHERRGRMSRTFVRLTQNVSNRLRGLTDSAVADEAGEEGETHADAKKKKTTEEAGKRRQWSTRARVIFTFIIAVLQTLISGVSMLWELIAAVLRSFNVSRGWDCQCHCYVNTTTKVTMEQPQPTAYGVVQRIATDTAYQMGMAAAQVVGTSLLVHLPTLPTAVLTAMAVAGTYFPSRPLWTTAAGSVPTRVAVEAPPPTPELGFPTPAGPTSLPPLAPQPAEMPSSVPGLAPAATPPTRASSPVPGPPAQVGPATVPTTPTASAAPHTSEAVVKAEETRHPALRAFTGLSVLGVLSYLAGPLWGLAMS